ncbi:family 43 glycosylhydrolase [Seonamhaeicola sp. ML3]|uniref:family 43 glycosylhydrolase n=1 Tax=Seonamhaeicola sp. ML3 TaxID=2937786 RepID=UPI00200EB03D|nr:family 43 glycosylhydrolase [Seonamhaeicola sp. ML3]
MKTIEQLRIQNVVTFILLILFCFTKQQTYAQNPFLPPTAFIPDGEPHVFDYKGEKRLFVYGSRDEAITGFCGYGHDVWSAPVKDLTKWTNHGEIFDVQQVHDIGYGNIKLGGRLKGQIFGAPDCVYNPVTKKYYLYTFLGSPYKMDGVGGPLPGSANYVPGFEDYGPKCLVAESTSPAGPFVNPIMCDWPPANEEGTFDPSALVDEQEDGSVRVYVFWGMRKGDRWAEVDPFDMHTIINPKTGKPDRNAWQKTLDPKIVPKSTVFEASSIKKIDDNHYVFVYSANELISALSYCYSNSPKGPWIYGGKIVQNNINWRRGNNHGSIVKAQDKWCVVYHKGTFNSKNRQAMIEPIEVKVEGDKVIIPQVEMTSQGVKSNGLDAFKRHNINIACYQSNKAFVDGRIRDGGGLNPMKRIDGPKTVIGFKYFNFGNKPIQDDDDLKLKLNSKILYPVTMTVFVAKPETVDDEDSWVAVGETSLYDINRTFTDYEISIQELNKNEKLNQIGGLKGKLAVFVAFAGRDIDLCEVVELEFAKGNAPTPNPLHDITISNNDGNISTIPTKSREGHSVKVMIENIKETVKEVIVKDANGKKIKVNANEQGIYAPKSFNFFMPNSDVSIEVSYN